MAYSASQFAVLHLSKYKTLVVPFSLYSSSKGEKVSEKGSSGPVTPPSGGVSGTGSDDKKVAFEKAVNYLDGCLATPILSYYSYSDIVQKAAAEGVSEEAAKAFEASKHIALEKQIGNNEVLSDHVTSRP